jgi:hypothetical protein
MYENLTSNVEFWTPEMAKDILKHNHVNRNLRERVHQAYRKDMEDGRWTMTGEPIQISESGSLLNGQHRMTALANCTKTEGVYLLTVRGLEEKTQLLMDQGAPRSIADMLKLEGGDGVKNATICAAIARWLTLAPEPDSEFMGRLKSKVSAAACLDTFRANPDKIVRAAEVGTATRKSTFTMSTAAIGYCYFHFANIDTQWADRYFWSWSEMSWAAEGDPRKAAYKRIQRMLVDSDVKHGPILSMATVSVMTRSWNMWRRGEESDIIHTRGREGWIPPVKPI